MREGAAMTRWGSMIRFQTDGMMIELRERIDVRECKSWMGEKVEPDEIRQMVGRIMSGPIPMTGDGFHVSHQEFKGYLAVVYSDGDVQSIGQYLLSGDVLPDAAPKPLSLLEFCQDIWPGQELRETTFTVLLPKPTIKGQS